MNGADAASTARGALALCLIVLAGWAFIAGTSPILGSAIRGGCGRLCRRYGDRRTGRGASSPT